MSSIRHQINIAAPMRAVWEALTTKDGLTSWWVDDARVDARTGGVVVLSSEGDDGEPVEERGMFHALQPTRRVEIKWDRSSAADTKGTNVQFSLARDGDETRVNVVHSGGGVLDDEERRPSLDKEWKQALRSLRDYLEV
jgi:uncharacterized protein YndB with AHSA1/START domain